MIIMYTFLCFYGAIFYKRDWGLSFVLALLGLSLLFLGCLLLLFVQFRRLNAILLV